LSDEINFKVQLSNVEERFTADE